MQPNWQIHFSALATALIAYALLGSAFLGLGRGCIRALGYRQADEPETLWLVWFGWVIYLLFLLTLHLILPLQAYVVAPPLVLGLGLFFRQQAGRRLLGSWRQGGVACVLALPVTVWVASRAMLAPDHYDSGLYHLQSVR